MVQIAHIDVAFVLQGLHILPVLISWWDVCISCHFVFNIWLTWHHPQMSDTFLWFSFLYKLIPSFSTCLQMLSPLSVLWYVSNSILIVYSTKLISQGSCIWVGSACFRNDQIADVILPFLVRSIDRHTRKYNCFAIVLRLRQARSLTCHGRVCLPFTIQHTYFETGHIKATK